MNAINCDDPEARCAEGNLFRFNGEDASFVVEGLVNGQSTGPLPHGERMILPNTLAGTTNSLAIKLRGTTYDICSLNDMNISQPQDVGVLVSEVPQGALAHHALLVARRAPRSASARGHAPVVRDRTDGEEPHLVDRPQHDDPDEWQQWIQRVIP